MATLQRRLIPYLARAFDAAGAPAAAVLSPLFRLYARLGDRAPWTRSALDRGGLAVVEHHYYQPIVFPSDISHDLNEDRYLPGVDLNEAGQLALVREFKFRKELEKIPLRPSPPIGFGYDNLNFGSGDAEMLYNMVRYFQPRRLIEIGSGMSTLIAQLAINENRATAPGYRCDHLCIEPYEQPWLEQIDVRVLRQRVECLDLNLFRSLAMNDILFIDSSHVVRPQGDVLFEFQQILPTLQSGVLVHFHDIFSPRDYPPDYILRQRRLWNEQYLLESFLAFNTRYEVLAAVNWLWHYYKSEMSEACPILACQPHRAPGSFWIRRLN